MPTAQEQAAAMQQAEQQIEFDPETASLEDLRAAAMREEPPQGQDSQQPRDENGRFVSQNPPKEGDSSNNPVEEVDEIVYRRVIDLGDGSGVQVFEGASPDELIEKLAKAQENATRKIRELSQKPTEQPKPRTAEDEWLLSQELLSNPTKTFEKLFEEKVGMPVTAFKTKMDRLNAFEQAQSEEAAAAEFMTKHPEYVPSASNARKIEKYVRTYNLDGTKAESIEQAYQDLSESGLLETKPATQQTQEPQPQPQTRIVSQPQEPARPQQTRTSSGISARRSVAQRSTPEPTEEDLYSMPLDKLRELAVRNGETQN